MTAIKIKPFEIVDSLTALMTKDGQIVKWDTRIILNPILIDPDFDVQEDLSSDDIDVPVVRRITN
jgi:hypothetical protein